MPSNFKNVSDVAAAFDSLSARVDLIARDVQYGRVRADLQSSLASMLSAYGVTLPALNPATGLYDPVALHEALNPVHPQHSQAIPQERQARLRRMLTDMGRLL